MFDNKLNFKLLYLNFIGVYNVIKQLSLTADHCENDEFYCNGRCIEREKVCDGTPDCTDYSDEVNCSPPPEPEVIKKYFFSL